MKEETAEVRPDSWKFDVTGSGITGPTVESQMADEEPAGEEEWLWKYDEHGKKIWYRKSGSGVDVEMTIPGGHAGSIRFATLPVATIPRPTPRPHGYWLVDDRGSYLWYRFVETGQYVRDRNVETINHDNLSPDEQPRPREKLAWTGVGRLDFTQFIFDIVIAIIQVAQNKPDYLRLLPTFCISTTKHVSLIMYM